MVQFGGELFGGNRYDIMQKKSISIQVISFFFLSDFDVHSEIVGPWFHQRRHWRHHSVPFAGEDVATTFRKKAIFDFGRQCR